MPCARPSACPLPAGLWMSIGKAGPAHDGVGPFPPLDQVVAGQAAPQEPARLAHADHRRHQGNICPLVTRGVFAQELQHLVGLPPAFQLGAGQVGRVRSVDAVDLGCIDDALARTLRAIQTNDADRRGQFAGLLPSRDNLFPGAFG